MDTRMNFSSTKWFSELEMEEHNIIHSYFMNPSLLGELHVAQDHALPQSFPSIVNTTCDLMEEKPLKVTNHISPSLALPPSTQILSFGNGGSNTNHEHSSRMKQEAAKRAHPLHRSKSQAQDHIIAERRRREKLTERFVALSALVPGLKKMDKASVLGDAIKHIKYLQERMAEFEEHKKGRAVEAVVLVNKSRLILDEESSYLDDESDVSNSVLPEIEVRVSDEDVLIKILCEKQKGHVTKILGEIEKLHLPIINSTVLPFGATLDITVIAKKERHFDMRVVDIVKDLRLALSMFM